MYFICIQITHDILTFYAKCDICSKLGMNISTAITIFASKMTREQRIPFDVAIDPNYNKKSEKTCEEFFLDRRMQLDE